MDHWSMLRKESGKNLSACLQDVALKQSPCQVEGLKRCLERERGDRKKCEKEIAAFEAACALPQKRETPRS